MEYGVYDDISQGLLILTEFQRRTCFCQQIFHLKAPCQKGPPQKSIFYHIPPTHELPMGYDCIPHQNKPELDGENKWLATTRNRALARSGGLWPSGWPQLCKCCTLDKDKGCIPCQAGLPLAVDKRPLLLSLHYSICFSRTFFLVHEKMLSAASARKGTEKART